MKRLLTNLSDWILWLVVGVLIVGLAVTFEGIQKSAGSAAPGTPLAIRTPTRAPYPPPDDKPPLRPPLPPIAVPTPRPPVTTTAQITRELAIAKAINNNPNFTDLQTRGQLTVTATLTTYGAYSGHYDTITSKYHPNLPIWVIELETPRWMRWSGPIGKETPQAYRGFGYVIDAVTGDLLFSFSIPDDGAKK